MAEKKGLSGLGVKKNTVGWTSLATEDFWLVTDFILGVRELAFGVLPMSLGHLWHARNGKPHLRKL
jgi:hypothetical protein